MATRAPRSRIRATVAAPIPLPPPVTTAILPSSLRSSKFQPEVSPTISLMRRSALVLLAVSLLAAGCGGGSSSQPAGSTKVTASDFKFDPNHISAGAGKVVIYLQNSGPSAHDIVVVDSTGKTVARSELVQSGDASVFTIASLGSGSYTFYCDVPGHKDSGMVGTLTVS